MAKNRKSPAFDESLLIGSISGLNRNKEAAPEPSAAPQPSAPTEPLPPEEVPPLENKATPEPERREAPASTLEPGEGESKGKKEPKPAATAKSQGKRWEYGRFLQATPGRKEARAYISETHHNKLRRILAFTDKKIALADYLENVLEEHFEQYEAQIKELYGKHLGS
ncbi:DUF3408 domain-containing protein [Rufibacter latericius]|nr:DUF3408 domain-containing protein [Rufibacter latericius]